MPVSQAYKSSLVTFGRHTPRALRHQILCQLALQYLGIHDGVSPDMIAAHTLEEPRPSLHRFHGALLFVDISGFTALSLRLKVEDLKNHINDYFTTMLSIVDKWDGDVIKFAGDALYVVWKTELSKIEVEAEENSTGSSAGSGNPKLPLPSRHYSKDFLNSNFGKAAVRTSLEKATACGLEISNTCCNHEVPLDVPVVDAPPSGGIISKILPKWTRSGGSKVAPSENSSNVAYLNVHAGVSFGLMAGVDIGAHDRWEFFLIGDPLHRVAEAEEEAAKGDIVICPDSHTLLHGPPPESTLGAALTSAKLGFLSSSELPCGCTRTPKGFFKITKVDAHSPRNNFAKLKRSRSKARVDENSSSVDISQNFRIFDDCCNEIEKLYISLQGILKAEVITFINRSELMARTQQKITNESQNQNHNINHGHSHNASGGVTGNVSGNTSITNPGKSKEKMILEILHNDLRKHMTDWFQYCVLEDIVKHVHEVARDDFYYDPKPRSTAFRLFLESMQKKNVNGDRLGRQTRVIPSAHDDDDDDDDDKPPPRLGGGGSSGGGGRRESIDAAPPMMRAMKNRNPSMNGSQFTALVKKASSKYLAQDTALSAEIRNVMVMFIKIVGLEMEMVVDDSGVDQVVAPNVHQAMLSFSNHQHNSYRSHTNKGSLRMSGGNNSSRMAQTSAAARAVTRGQSIGAVFDLLDRTASEVESDMLMLNRVQQCMEVLCKVFSETGGQLRQFIVDDKGTVCIGTFGLKGSVGVDNAAAALETAKSIVIRLQSLELTASIGITSGKAYCGLVGSPLRHEYAVMGPSTNLSARLMCKAPAFGVICDIETKNRDRTHGFEPLTEVQAKGYAQPVMTYKPIFEDILHLLKARDSQVYQALSPNRGLLQHTKTQSSLRVSQDWYLPSLGKSMSMQWRSGGEATATPPAAASPRASPRTTGISPGNSIRAPVDGSPRAPPIDLSGRQASVRQQKLARTPSQSVFTKRRKSIRDNTLVKEELLKMNNSKLRLHGREQEMRDILSFLFPNITHKAPSSRNIVSIAPKEVTSSMRSIQSIEKAGDLSPSGSLRGIQPPLLTRSISGLSHAEYEISSPARMVVVSGGEGTGKSALLDAVANKVFIAAKVSPNFSVYTFRNRPSSLEMLVPFHSFKPIIQEMLARVDTAIMRQSSQPGNAQMLKREISHRRLKVSVKESILNGLTTIFPAIPSRMQSWRPLLGSASIIMHEEDNEVTSKLQGAERTQCTIDLLVAMINAFPVITKSAVLLIM